MSVHEENKTNKGLVILIIVIIIVALLVGGYFLLKDNGILTSSTLNETITAENYEELTEKIAEELGDVDELYYFSYATMYYMMTDGMASIFSEDSEDESAMYANIYGKTATDLINEGKELMEENDITIEEWKQNLEDLSDEDLAVE